jgi:hypothetical protein
MFHSYSKGVESSSLLHGWIYSTPTDVEINHTTAILFIASLKLKFSEWARYIHKLRIIVICLTTATILRNIAVYLPFNATSTATRVNKLFSTSHFICCVSILSTRWCCIIHSLTYLQQTEHVVYYLELSSFLFILLYKSKAFVVTDYTSASNLPKFNDICISNRNPQVCIYHSCLISKRPYAVTYHRP